MITWGILPARRKRRSEPFWSLSRDERRLIRVFSRGSECVTLAVMGSKDKGKKEVKKAPKPKPKPAPGGRREVFTPAPPK
jgi:hypothetical protein